MNTYVRNPHALDIEAAMAGLPLVETRGLYTDGPADVLIERLLDQLAQHGREAFSGEEDGLRQAIDCYARGNLHGAVSHAMYAASLGAGRVLGSGFDGERAMPLRAALAQARLTHLTRQTA